jgi:hypothetical protein
MNRTLKNIMQSRWFYPALLAVSALAVFLPVLRNDFLYLWDDQWAVINRYTEGGWNGRNLWAILTEYYHGQYAPLNQLLYLSLYTAFGYNPFWFHLASLLFHLVNIGLLYAVMKKLLQMSGRVDAKNVNILSFLTTLIFAVHSCNVEPVAWMSASKVPLYALFYFGATYTILLYIEKRNIKYYIFALLLFSLSFLGKDQAVTFPLWMLLLYWFLHIRLTDKWVWKTTLPFFLLSVVFGLMTMLSQSASGQGALTAAPAYPIWQRMVYGCYSLFEYLSKTLLPFKLSYLYPFPSVIGDPLPNWLLVYPALLVLVPVCLWKYLSQWTLKFGLLFFLIHITIVLNVIELSRFSIIADRYLYVAIIGPAFILSYFAVYMYQKLKTFGRIAVCALFACYVLYLGVYSGIRVNAWYDTDSLKKEMRELLKERNDYELRTKN